LRLGANIMVTAENVQVCGISAVPRGQGTASSFYRPRGGGLQSCCTVLGYVLRCSVQRRDGWPSWRILLLAGRHGESCACLGAASRVVVWEPLVWSLSVRQVEGWANEGLEVT
jgi:hypothetical protein